MTKQTIKISGAVFFCTRAFISNALRERGITPSMIERNKHDENRLVYMYPINKKLLRALNSIDPEKLEYVVV